MSAALLAGCSSEPPEGVPEIADAWRMEIDREASAGRLSEQEREVLADYWVTDEEYARLREPIPGCMADLGFEAILHPRGVDQGADPDVWGDRDMADPEVAAAGDAAHRECTKDVQLAESYYWDLRENPQKWDFFEALEECAKRLGLSEGVGLTTEELKVGVAESEGFLAECRSDPWALAQGLEPEGEPEVNE